MSSIVKSPTLGFRYSPLEIGLFLDSVMKILEISFGSVSSFTGKGARFNHLNIFKDVFPITELQSMSCVRDESLL